jgi:uncharacterized protein YdaU (DUF1376 family)
MTKRRPPYSFFPDTWRGQTAGHTRVERDIHMQLLLLLWEAPRQQRQNDERLHREIGLTPEERPTLEWVIGNYFYRECGNWIRSEHIDREWESWERASSAGASRVKYRYNKENASTPSPTPSKERKKGLPKKEVTSKSVTVAEMQQDDDWVDGDGVLWRRGALQ